MLNIWVVADRRAYTYYIVKRFISLLKIHNVCDTKSYAQCNKSCKIKPW